MKRILFILLLTIPLIGFGQGWEKTFGGNTEEDSKSVQQTSDGGYIVCGRTESFGNGDDDIYLIKTDSQGNSLWTKTYGGNSDDIGSCVQQTNDGGYIICGITLSSGNDMDIYLIKTDGNGDSLWTRTFGGTSWEESNSVQQTTDGGYIITGKKGGDVYLIKTDGNGDSLWTNTYNNIPNSFSEGNFIQQTTVGDLVICGVVETFLPIDRRYVYLIKTDGNGIQQWYQTYSNPVYNNTGMEFKETSDGGYIITGETDTDVYLIKTDGNGDSLWTKTFGGSDVEKGNSIQQTTDGGYIICGETESFGNGDEDVYLIKTDGNGESLWTRTFGGSGEENGNSVQQTTDGGYIISGRTYSFGSGDGDVYLIKTDGNGNITSTFNIPTPSSNRKLEKVVDILGRETKPQQNTPFIEIYDDGSTEKKIVVE